MKIQITPQKRLDDHLVIWPEQTGEVDIVLDPRRSGGLVALKGSVTSLYCFGLIGETKHDLVLPMLQRMHDMMAEGGTVYFIENNCDYLFRAYTGGDLSLIDFCEKFAKKSYINQPVLIELLGKAGFKRDKMKTWTSVEGLKIQVAHFEFVLSASK